MEGLRLCGIASNERRRTSSFNGVTKPFPFHFTKDLPLNLSFFLFSLNNNQSSLSEKETGETGSVRPILSRNTRQADLATRKRAILAIFHYDWLDLPPITPNLQSMFVFASLCCMYGATRISS